MACSSFIAATKGLTRAAASTVEAPVDGNLPTDAWLKKFATYGALLLVVDDDRVVVKGVLLPHRLRAA